MSLEIIGSVSGPIVSGSGYTSGTYTAGETLTVSKSGGSGSQYMYEANIDGMGSCSFSTLVLTTGHCLIDFYCCAFYSLCYVVRYGFTRTYSATSDQVVTAPTDGSTIVIKSLRASGNGNGVRARTSRVVFLHLPRRYRFALSYSVHALMQSVLPYFFSGCWWAAQNYVNEVTLSDLAATPVPTMRPSPLPTAAPYTPNTPTKLPVPAPTLAPVTSAPSLAPVVAPSVASDTATST